MKAQKMSYPLRCDLRCVVDMKRCRYTIYADGKVVVHMRDFEPGQYASPREVMTKRAVFAAAVWMRDNLPCGRST